MRAPGRRAFALGCAVALAGACGRGDDRPAAPRGMIAIDGGGYTIGSDAAERALGYDLSPPAVRAQRWYDRWERSPERVDVERFALDRTPVTHSAYAEFVAATGRPVPHIDAPAYQAQGFLVHDYDAVRRFLWSGGPPAAIHDHPVVLVDHADAEAYCRWRGERSGVPSRLPTEAEWEAACRGPEGRTFPWGHAWEYGRIQNEAATTANVDAHPDGATPAGVHDLAGNVFEWTASAMPDGRPLLKGCAWDDAPGTCRCAFRHGRPAASKHILIGFRCAADL